MHVIDRQSCVTSCPYGTKLNVTRGHFTGEKGVSPTNYFGAVHLNANYFN